MKRIICIALVFIMAAALLCGCGAKKAEPAPAAQKSILEFLDADFAERINGFGENPATELFYYVDNNYCDYIYDTEVMAEILADLCKLKASETGSSIQIDDGGIGFRFSWGDTGYWFAFSTTEYFSLNNLCYEIADRSPLKAAMNRAQEYIDYMNSQPEGAEQKADEPVAYPGITEGNRIERVDVYHNGDEAPDCMELTVNIGGQSYTAYLDGAYEILDSSWDGDRLTVVFRSGDFYSHEAISTVILHVENGEIVMDEA